MDDFVVKEAVREATDLVQLAERYTKLRQSGKSHVGCCPLPGHDDSTPSFHVYPEGKYYCHGCKKGGDAFDLVMECEGKPFIEALKDLAQEASIPIDQSGSFSRQQKNDWSLIQSASQHFQDAVQYYRKDFDGYLEERGISKQTAEMFRLGFAPGRLDSLSALEKKFSSKALIEGGFLRINDQGQVYPFFRNRLILPILNQKGNALGFVGRDITGSSKCKYLNWDGPTFDRETAILGLNTVSPNAQQVYVSEGPLDAIVVAQALQAPSIATLGSKVTEKQLVKVLSLAPQVTFLIDGDPAGKAMAVETARAIPRLISKPISIQFVFCPQDTDPGSYLISNSLDALPRYDLEDVLLKTARHRWNLDEWYGQACAAEWLSFSFPEGRENTVNRVLRHRIAGELNLPDEALVRREVET